MKKYSNKTLRKTKQAREYKKLTEINISSNTKILTTCTTRKPTFGFPATSQNKSYIYAYEYHSYHG
ncbi:hypothetical protein PR048_018685 [Dryococelus australis]|uniref:Uncharacterized protein n=1 Tax=Dryococelus australis TaxID=614101 RepID=A0ABQ9HCY6_9NEOP|nr:hypothetical protein PR048_018685 [Dryococelus australis]